MGGSGVELPIRPIDPGQCAGLGLAAGVGPALSDRRGCSETSVLLNDSGGFGTACDKVSTLADKCRHDDTDSQFRRFSLGG